MKVFIVFLAMMLVLTSFIAFSADMDRYVRLQAHLKALAEECAAGAALFTDESRYAEGDMVIDYDYAYAYTGFMADMSIAGDPPFRGGEIRPEIIIFDDEKGYSGIEAYGLRKRKPTVVVTLEYVSPRDIFRLPFLTEYTVTRTATYQWEDGLEGS